MFEKLLEVLQSMGISLQNSGFTMDVAIFQDSPDYILALRGFYDAFIAFWSEALVFSKKKKSFRTMFWTSWTKYDDEVKALWLSMERHQRALSQCAEATNRQRSHEARIQEEDERSKSEAARIKAEDERSKSEAARMGMLILKAKIMLTSSRVAK